MDIAVLQSSVLRSLILFILLVGVSACATNTTNTTVGNTRLPLSDKSIDSASKFVVIDQSEPSFTVFTGIPKALEEKELEEIKRMVSGKETYTMLTWQKFLENVTGYTDSVILRNDYPNIMIVDGIVCLVASKQGTGAPWGLTWNGGIALTFNDYQHARRTYETFKADPTSYRPERDPRRDPIHPNGHLSFGGCK